MTAPEPLPGMDELDALDELDDLDDCLALVEELPVRPMVTLLPRSEFL